MVVAGTGAAGAGGAEAAAGSGAGTGAGPGAGPMVVLVGAPGAGKTTVGTRLAQRWGVGFRDTDADIEAALGTTVADIFLDHGEEYFRAAERRAVAAALAEHPGVLALGGGAVLDGETRARLAGHRVVYLEVGVSDAVRRVGLARDRPLLVEGPRTRLAALLKARRPLYAQVASAVVDTAGHEPDEVADLVVAALAGLPAAGGAPGERAAWSEEPAPESPAGSGPASRPEPGPVPGEGSARSEGSFR